MYQPKFKNGKYLQTPKTDWKDSVDVIIGNDKQEDFQPQRKICRWDNEVNHSHRLIHNEKNPTVTQDENGVHWIGEKMEAHFYDLPIDETYPEGASETEIVLLEKPDTNVVQFTLQDKGLDYFYQPALTPEEIAKGASRPENVVGSYAVYASENKINYVGGKEYKCGKVGHIYRPNIVDANGTQCWGDLLIENGILSVTIPQDFLDNAVYPVRHAAGLTFGYTTKGGTNSLMDATTCGDVATGAVGTITSMSIYNSYNPGGLMLALWSSSYATIANGSTGSSAITGNPLTINLSSPAVTAQTYYLGVIFPNGGNIGDGYYDTASNLGWNKGVASYISISSPTITNKKWSIYATYTAGGGTAYTLTCAVTAFTISTVNATFHRLRKLTSAVTSFSVTPINSVLSHIRKLVASVTAFSVTTVNANLSRLRSLVTSVTSFSVTTINAVLSYTPSVIAYTMICAVTSFSLTTINAIFNRKRVLIASVNNFTVSTVNASFNLGRKLTAAVTSFSVTTVNSIFSRSRELTASVTSFSVTGINANLSHIRNLSASVTSFSVSTVNATLSYIRKLVSSVTSYTVTGINAALTYTNGSIVYPAQIFIANTSKVCVWSGSGDTYIQVN